MKTFRTGAQIDHGPLPPKPRGDYELHFALETGIESRWGSFGFQARPSAVAIPIRPTGAGRPQG